MFSPRSSSLRTMHILHSNILYMMAVKKDIEIIKRSLQSPQATSGYGGQLPKAQAQSPMGFSSSSSGISMAFVPQPVHHGVCKSWNSVSGFGYISVEGGIDVLVHRRDIRAMRSCTNLAEGEMVEFRIVSYDGGKLKAVDVTGHNEVNVAQ